MAPMWKHTLSSRLESLTLVSYRIDYTKILPPPSITITHVSVTHTWTCQIMVDLCCGAIYEVCIKMTSCGSFMNLLGFVFIETWIVITS